MISLDLQNRTITSRVLVLRLVPVMAWQRSCGRLFDDKGSALCFAATCQLKLRLTITLLVRQSLFQLRTILLFHCFLISIWFAEETPPSSLHVHLYLHIDQALIRQVIYIMMPKYDIQNQELYNKIPKTTDPAILSQIPQ